jgi:N-acetyl sugar amidotransferase
LNRCSRCLYPESRPDAHFVDGVCSACRAYDQRAGIDWGERQGRLDQVVKGAKIAGSHTRYDVIVPVSGGKDSTFQAVYLKGRGLRVLGVNAGTDMLSDIGRRNLDNLKNIIDVIEVTPNIEIRTALIRKGLFEVGDMSWPEHMAIWSIPTRVALQMGVPLIVWGEQPQREYAAPEGVPVPQKLDADWVAQFGGLLGMRLGDLEDELGDLSIFRMPSIEETESLSAIWLGDYIDWDGWRNAFVAQQHGFEVLPHPVEGSLANYENLDNHITVLRDYLRFLKYGYGRATDIASNHIRRGRLTREEGLEMVLKVERFPWTSLGKPIKDVLAYCGLTLGQFVGECDRWTNRSIFADTKHPDGTPEFR